MIVRISRIDPALPLPEYHTPGAVAFDMYTREDAVIAPRELRKLPSNLIIEVPEGYALLVASRSSGPGKGFVPPHGVGVIDQDYHGPADEIQILVHNFTDSPIIIKRGDRVAQGLLVPILRAEWEEAPSSNKESRGGFGSTD